MNSETAELRPRRRPRLSAKDYASDQEVRWCPGCGDYAILKAVQKTLAELDADPDNTVFVSGIGCAARFPYYLDTYGFHTIHGRAAAVATGIKLARPELDVWIASGDGDSLSIGGNHLFHLLRRNVDVQYLLFNNEIYGLTKGQFSPTSRLGTRSPSSPGGSLDRPASAVAFALGAGGRFIARGLDVAQPELVRLLLRAHAHRGTSFVEILQNCIVYNDGIFDPLSAKKTAADNRLWVEHGKPLRYGAAGDRGLRLSRDRLALEAVVVGAGGVDESDLLCHDETDPVLAGLLAGLQGPDLPTALGVLYCEPRPSFESSHRPPAVAEGADLDALLRRGHTWQVGG